MRRPQGRTRYMNLKKLCLPERNCAATPSAAITRISTLRIIGHCSRLGGQVWGAHVALERLQATDPILQALISRLANEEQALLHERTAESFRDVCRARRKLQPQSTPSKTTVSMRRSWSERKASLLQLQTNRREANAQICSKSYCS